MKVEHLNLFGVVHRQVTSSNGLSTVSCDLPYIDATAAEYVALNAEGARTDEPLSCITCLVADWRAAFARAVSARTGRMSSGRSNL